MNIVIARIKNMTCRELEYRFREIGYGLYERYVESRRTTDIRKILKDNAALMPRCPIEAFSQKEQAYKLWNEHFGNSILESISMADNVCGNRIPIFSDAILYDKQVAWRRECPSGADVPLEFYRDVDTMNSENIDDIKIIWEINRHNFMIFLGKAYYATSDRRYYDKWRELIISWIDRNPYNYGINWESSLECAVRSINWIWASFFFIDELERDREFQIILFKNIYLHGLHISRHLSYYFSPNTHLTGEALGLLYIGMCYPQMRNARTWIETANKILNAELQRQVFEDGGYFEMSTYYHKYTIDFYLHFFILNIESLSARSDSARRIWKCIKHLALLSEPDGRIPLLGDSDGGQLLFLDAKRVNIQSSCCTGAILFDDGELKHLCRDTFSEEAMWLLGESGFKKFIDLESYKPQTYHSINMQTGLFCFRTGISERDNILSIDCGKHGWNACGHSHSDLLSYEWYTNGRKVIVDPGTYKYSGAHSLRNEYRSSQKHNTITINDISQSMPENTFTWSRISHPKYSNAVHLNDYAYFEGEHDAYESLGCSHKRIIIFLGRFISIVIDILNSRHSTVSFASNLQFNEGEIIGSAEHLYQYRNNNTDSYIRLLFSGEMDIDILDGKIFPDYNNIVRAPMMSIKGHNIEKSEIIITLLSPNRELLENFHLDGKRAFACRYLSSEYHISMGDVPIESIGDLRNVPCSVYHRDEEHLLMILSNSDRATDSSGHVCFKSNRIEQLLIATLQDSRLVLRTDQAPDCILLPYDIREAIINDNPVTFNKEGDIVHLAPINR